MEEAPDGDAVFEFEAAHVPRHPFWLVLRETSDR
jgi:hypothetical protein